MVSVGNHEYDHSSGGQNDPSGAPGMTLIMICLTHIHSTGNGFKPTWGDYGDDSNGMVWYGMVWDDAC